jgi:predicted pyridoxine 5'-phosphate oxidase superfamily flavin-nucleotide-binding protein
MGTVYDAIDDKLAAWIGRQRLFFVGTAPSGADGHVNVSPKGPIESLRILDPHTVAYLDVIGSGAETIAHLRDNGRIVVMLCSFEGPPRILRLHGRGEVLEADAVDFDGVEMPPGTERAVIRVGVERIADSCGYGVPVMRFEGHRPQYEAWAGSKLRKGGERALDAYAARHNARSIDGLPAVDVEDLEPA